EAFAEALSTLRPTTTPGTAAPSYAPPGAPAPQIDADATVQDFYRDGSQAPAQAPALGAGQSVTPVQGQAQGPPPQEMRTRLAQPAEDDVRTSEMRLPPSPQGPQGPRGPQGPPGGGEQTVVDDPGGRGVPFGQAEKPTSPDNDNDRTAAKIGERRAGQERRLRGEPAGV